MAFTAAQKQQRYRDRLKALPLPLPSALPSVTVRVTEALPSTPARVVAEKVYHFLQSSPGHLETVERFLQQLSEQHALFLSAIDEPAGDS